MLWVLKRTVSMRRFFWAPKTYFKINGLENIYIFTLKIFAYLSLCLKMKFFYVFQVWLQETSVQCNILSCPQGTKIGFFQVSSDWQG